ncbi:MAG: cytochrome P450 [Actinobacteria bacterium]|nr:cytochrome P450 [Actinomycetota bacterium]
MNAAGVDLADVDLFRDGIPHDLFATLRRDAPVSSNGRFWSVVRHVDAVSATRDPTLSSNAGIMLFDQPGLVSGDSPHMMIEMDPPQHTRYRRLVNKGFTPRMVGRLEDHVREISGGFIDRADAAGTCDFITDVASQLPMQVIAELLGVPAEDRQKVADWSNAVIAFDDEQPAMAPMAAMYGYSEELAQAKGEAPGDDLMTALLDAEVDGEQLSPAEVNLFFLLLAVAGNETTRTAIGHGMLAFCERPDQWRRLRADRSLVATAVEEILRWSTPIIHFRRTATEATELGGQAISAGERVVVWYCSANFDEDVFDDPMRFDVARAPNDHVAFGGGGPHFCLGANLARLEIRVMFEELLNRFAHVELAGPVERIRSNFTNGLRHMPVKFTRTD